MSAVSAKGAAVSAGVIALLGAGWLGASVYTGRTVQSRMAEIAQEGASRPGLVFSDLRHERGLLASSGQVRLSLRDACERPGGREQVALEVRYELSHLIGPGGIARFSWAAQPAGEAAATLARLFGPEARLTGEGQVGFGGAVESSVSLPELVASLTPAGGSGARGGEWRLAPTTGRVQVHGSALSLALGSPRLALQGVGQAVEAKGVAFAVDLSDRRRGVGSLVLSAEGFTVGPVRGEGLRFASAVVERGDRIDIQFTPSVKQIGSGEQSAQQLELEFALRNLHGPSLRTLETLASESCDLSDLPEPAQARLREAVGTLLAQGFSAGVTRLKGAFRDGAIDGRVDVELKPAGGASPTPATAPLQPRVRANGEVTLTGSWLPAPQRQMLVSMGVAVESAGNLKASFDFADGVLRANGRTVDATAATGVIASLERRIAALTEPRAARREEGSREAGEPKTEDAPAVPGGVVLPAPGGKR